jgi:hypothetical protein
LISASIFLERRAPVANQANMIKPGSILMHRGAVRPEYFQAEDDPCPGSWILVAHSQTDQLVEANLEKGGWTFFLPGQGHHGQGFWIRSRGGAAGALGRLIAKAKLQRCNSLQIDSVASRSFLGIPFVDVAGHPRQIQKGMTFYWIGPW